MARTDPEMSRFLVDPKDEGLRLFFGDDGGGKFAPIGMLLEQEL